MNPPKETYQVMSYHYPYLPLYLLPSSPISLTGSAYETQDQGVPFIVETHPLLFDKYHLKHVLWGSLDGKNGIKLLLERKEETLEPVPAIIESLFWQARIKPSL